jgi:hypothetical protein
MRRYVLAVLCVTAFFATVGQVSAQRDQKNRWVNVVNKSSITMVAIYAVPSRLRRADVGGRDLIPNDTIAPGTYLQVNFDLGDGECLLDLRAKGNDGRTWTRRNVDVCAVEDWTLTN